MFTKLRNQLKMSKSSPAIESARQQVEQLQSALKKLSELRAQLKQESSRIQSEQSKADCDLQTLNSQLQQQQTELLRLEREQELSDEVKRLKQLADVVNDFASQLHSAMSDLISAIEGASGEAKASVSFSRVGGLGGWQSIRDNLPVTMTNVGSPNLKLGVIADLKSAPGSYQHIAQNF